MQLTNLERFWVLATLDRLPLGKDVATARARMNLFAAIEFNWDWDNKPPQNPNGETVELQLSDTDMAELRAVCEAGVTGSAAKAGRVLLKLLDKLPEAEPKAE